MHTFKKEERLCNKKLIEQLYHNGSSFLCYPFKVSWVLADQPQSYPAQVVFSVSKKKFKRAVDRNLVKRRSREAYRLHKQQLLYDALSSSQINILLSITYIGKEIEGYNMFEKRMIKLLNQLSAEVLK
ncbi:ribonuclease P protein component [Mucilaginibacter limnophilus]|uniref:Ribonuclease P protein component n=1 Tax=Mucilaginibacter limnophilus TaxID=1932778 RepID=A0A3S2Y5N2_9SPHI|nr:ribonuclease P protein component [Mucilaginibacter limnophilus]RVU02621.1 ribonuclease P protein component [Mucilaginibacter limnophilus]